MLRPLLACTASLAAVLITGPPALAAILGEDGRIVFSSGPTGDIFTMNADGSAPTRLTNDPEVQSGPVWSPDGKRIAYEQRSAPVAPKGIYVMNADGTGVTRLKTNAAWDWETLPPKVGPPGQPPADPLVTTPPPRDVDGPAVAISRRTVRVTHAGVLVVRLGCPAGEPGGCRGRLTLRTIVRRRTVNLGSTVFAIPAGRSTAVTLRLSRMKRTLLQKRRQVRVTATVRAVDQAGNARISTATFTMKAPKGRKRS